MRITFDEIIQAMRKVADDRPARAEGTRYAVMDPRTGETYSPKQILRIIISPRYRFFGGKGLRGANQVFREYAFPVGKRRTLLREWRELKRRSARISNTDRLLKTLFSQKWRLLPSENKLRAGVSHLPGVYVLACSDQKLQGTRVRERDVFYVGMACEGGLNTRLVQFRKGIRYGGFHSAADRFYRIWLGREPYNPQAPTKLYFAYVPVTCVTAKAWRTPEDLRDLGRVVELEYVAIARVKEKIGHEPLLNKK